MPSIIERAFEKLDLSPDSGKAARKQAKAAAPADGAVGTVDAGVIDSLEDELEGLDAGRSPGSGPSGPGQRKEPGKARSREVPLDLESLHGMGYLTPETPQSALSEQFRRIKRPLLKKIESGTAAEAGYPNLIAVTSALPGEGKTFNAINLAISMAMELDRTVLLVDADVAKSDVTRRAGIDVARGLTDVLVDKDVDLSDVLIRTDIPKLTILPSGSHHTNVTELLASDEMKRLVAELAERYADRVVIFDAPPMLATSGAGVLASLVGQVVFVVRAEYTQKSEVREALQQLGRREGVGLVLNRSREWYAGKKGYGYYYGYGQ